MDTIIETLVDKGVSILNPESVYIDSTVNLDLISTGITIHPGCRISGEKTSIGPGSVLGEETPVTIKNCQLGKNVALKGGFFSDATILDDVTFNSGAHVRPGTLLEEQASCAHNVGLKQTILMPFATLGSLINFCDCLMAGGTDRRNHSEVGSSYIHFNYTPYKDKATPSLIGDVSRGVMMDQSPIFLGGQGGLVGPVRLEYGTVIAAGAICRRDVLEENKLVYGQHTRKAGEMPYKPGISKDIPRILKNNFIYIGNIHALHQWYTHVRSIFADNTPYDKSCFDGALKQIKAITDERISRLDQLADNLDGHEIHKSFCDSWKSLAPKLELGTEYGETETRNKFLEALSDTSKDSYMETIKGLSPSEKQTGTQWLQSIVNDVASLWAE